MQYLGQVPINNLRVAINHYSGTTSTPIEFEFRMRYEGKVYAKKIRMLAGTGTQGAGDRNSSRAWIKINLSELMGLQNKVN